MYDMPYVSIFWLTLHLHSLYSSRDFYVFYRRGVLSGLWWQNGRKANVHASTTIRQRGNGQWLKQQSRLQHIIYDVIWCIHQQQWQHLNWTVLNQQLTNEHNESKTCLCVVYNLVMVQLKIKCDTKWKQTITGSLCLRKGKCLESEVVSVTRIQRLEYDPDDPEGQHI